MKPLIGITAPYEDGPEPAGARLYVRLHYPEAIHRAGGVPVVLPPYADPAEVLSRIDGLLIPGGDDIPSSAWGVEPHPKEEPIQPMRFALEQELLRLAPKELPVLGICYGCQLMGFISGGKPILHLPDVVGH